MSEMRKTVWSKLKSHFRISGRYREERVTNFVNKLNVNEEYMEAFRTNSYIEIYNKVHASSSSSPHLHLHLSDYLLEPQQETLVSMTKNSNLHPLLIDYFEATLEASNICELLLQSIHQTRANYRIIKRIIKLSNRVPYTRAMFEDLASFSLLKNPLSDISPIRFLEMHNTHNLLLQKLTLKYRKIRRRIEFTRVCKKILGCALIISYSVIALALLVFAIHTIVFTIAAPGLIACSLGLMKKRSKKAKTRLVEREGAQLEVAAKGVYILINDFDTMSRLVRRLYDETEHRKAIAEMCVRNGKSEEVLKEVVREFRVHETCFLEQLEELEEHIYLCFLNINRTRRLVVQEIMVEQSQST